MTHKAKSLPIVLSQRMLNDAKQDLLAHPHTKLDAVCVCACVRACMRTCVCTQLPLFSQTTAIAINISLNFFTQQHISTQLEPTPHTRHHIEKQMDSMSHSLVETPSQPHNLKNALKLQSWSDETIKWWAVSHTHRRTHTHTHTTLNNSLSR